MTHGNPDLVRFGRFSFDERTLELFGESGPLALQPKPSVVLAELIAARGGLVSRERLYEAAWGDTVVEFDLALNRCIRDIRATLGDDARAPSFIQTVPRRGYRLVAPVEIGPRRSQEPRRWRAAAVAATAGVLWLASSVAWGGAAQGSPDTILAFHGVGSEVSGIDRQLQESVRRRLRLNTRAPRSSGLLVSGVLVPAPDGALLEVTLVRLDSGREIWSGRYNPLCDRIVGDPIELISGLISREVVARS